MADGVFNEIAQRLMQRIVIGVDPDRRLGAGDGHAAMPDQRERRHRMRHFESQRGKIGPFVTLQGQGLELGHKKQLLDQPAHAPNIFAERGSNRLVAEGIEMRGQNRERGAQLMGRIGREIPLRAKTLVEAVERGVDGADQRGQLPRQTRRGQTTFARGRRDARGLQSQRL